MKGKKSSQQVTLTITKLAKGVTIYATSNDIESINGRVMSLTNNELKVFKGVVEKMMLFSGS